MQPTPQDIQLMSKRRVLSFKPQLRLEWRGQDGQNEKEQSDHSASLGDSITSSTRISFSVHTTPEMLAPYRRQISWHRRHRLAACEYRVQIAPVIRPEENLPRTLGATLNGRSVGVS
jgi:hypothetical protein